jgi:hypothetical protein
MTVGTGGTSEAPREAARGVAPRLHAAVAKTLPPDDSFGNLIADALTPIINEIAILTKQINELRNRK